MIWIRVFTPPPQRESGEDGPRATPRLSQAQVQQHAQTASRRPMLLLFGARMIPKDRPRWRIRPFAIYAVGGGKMSDFPARREIFAIAL
jgi:hypothetical protein